MKACSFSGIPRTGYFCIFFFSFLSYQSFAQLKVDDKLVSAYQHSTNSEYSVQWTIGEVFNETIVSGDVAVSTGLNETNIVFIVTDLEVQEEALQNIQAFPNPLANVLTIESDKFNMNELSFDFVNASGQKISVPVIDVAKSSAKFRTTELRAGIYILRIQNIKTTQTAYIKLIQK